MLDMNWVRDQMNNASSRRLNGIAEIKQANPSGGKSLRQPAWFLTGLAIGALLAVGTFRSTKSLPSVAWGSLE